MNRSMKANRTGGHETREARFRETDSDAVGALKQPAEERHEHARPWADDDHKERAELEADSLLGIFREYGPAVAIRRAREVSDQLTDPDGAVCRTLGIRMRGPRGRDTTAERQALEVACRAARDRAALEDLAYLLPSAELSCAIGLVDQVLGDMLEFLPIVDADGIGGRAERLDWRWFLVPMRCVTAIRYWVRENCALRPHGYVELSGTLAGSSDEPAPVVRQIDEWIARRTPSTMILAGREGSGRTTLLMEMLRRWSEQPAERVLLVPMLNVMEQIGVDGELGARHRVSQHLKSMMVDAGENVFEGEDPLDRMMKRGFHVVVVIDGFPAAMRPEVLEVVRRLKELVEAGVSVLAACERSEDLPTIGEDGCSLRWAMASELLLLYKRGALVRVLLQGLSRAQRRVLLDECQDVSPDAKEAFIRWMQSTSEEDPLLTVPALYRHALRVLERGGFQRPRCWQMRRPDPVRWLIEETTELDTAPFELGPENVLPLSRRFDESEMQFFEGILLRTHPERLGVFEPALWSWINYRLIRKEARSSLHSASLLRRAEQRFCECVSEDPTWLTTAVLRETAVLIDSLDPKSHEASRAAVAVRALLARPEATKTLGLMTVSYYGAVDHALRRLLHHIGDQATYGVMLRFDLLEIAAVVELFQVTKSLKLSLAGDVKPVVTYLEELRDKNRVDQQLIMLIDIALCALSMLIARSIRVDLDVGVLGRELAH